MYIATRHAHLEPREAGFLVSNKLEQLEFKLEKNIGIKKHAGKVRNGNFPISSFNCQFFPMSVLHKVFILAHELPFFCLSAVLKGTIYHHYTVVKRV